MTHAFPRLCFPERTLIRLLTPLLCLFLLLAAAAAGETVRDIRVAQQPDGSVRCVIEVSEAPVFRFRNASGAGGRVSVELSHIRRGPFSVSGGAPAPLDGVRVEQIPDKGLYYVHLETLSEVSVDAQTISNPWRVVLDVRGGDAAAPGALGSGSSAPSMPPGTILGPTGSYGAPRPSPLPGPSVNRPATTSAPQSASIPSSPGAFLPRVIVVDPGHGGRHRGGLGKVNGRQVDEAITTLPIAFELEKLLAADPLFQPRLTRRVDEYVSLRERTRRAEQFGGHLFVSIHYNAVPKNSSNSARGLEIFTWSPKNGDTVAERYLQQLDNEEGGRSDVDQANPRAMPVLNQMMMDSLNEQAWESTRVAASMEDAFLTDGYFRRYNRGLKKARFKVLENYGMPSILVEVGFISHPEEAKLAVTPSFQRKVAQLMYEGIVRYYDATDPGFRAARSRVLASRR